MTLSIWLLRFFLLFNPGPAAAPMAPPAPSYVGFWLMQDQDAVLQISRQGGAYVGHFVAFRKTGSDPEKKSKLNTSLLKDMKPDGSELTGQLSDPKSGKEFTTTLALTGPNALEMRVKAMSMTLHKETWTRQASATN